MRHGTEGWHALETSCKVLSLMIIIVTAIYTMTNGMLDVKCSEMVLRNASKCSMFCGILRLICWSGLQQKHALVSCKQGSFDQWCCSPMQHVVIKDEGVALPTTVSLAAAMQLEQDRNLYKVHIVQSVWNHN